MTSVVSLQNSAECPRCGILVLRPEWSESIGPQHIVNIWHCQICGNEFETAQQGAAQTLSDTELVRAFFPNLLVA